MCAFLSLQVGGPVVVGGVTFSDFELGIVAHSDGEAVYHWKRLGQQESRKTDTQVRKVQTKILRRTEKA